MLATVQFLFFFFQAEDGIRDIGVTGVQTCALPIFYRQEDLGIRRFFAAGTPAEAELQQVAGLVQAAAAAGIEDGVDVKDLREETGRAATPLARDLNLLEQVSAVVLDEEGAAHPADGAPTPGEAAAAARELAEHHERVDQSRVEMMRGYAETTDRKSVV